MSHLPTLITDLALILASAGLMTLIFKRLKQPSVLGYIVAGILAGPHITLTPTVIDSGNIQTWADIGVVFLLFALGLEFSFEGRRSCYHRCSDYHCGYGGFGFYRRDSDGMETDGQYLSGRYAGHVVDFDYL